MIGVDTSVVVRMLTGQPAVQAEAARRLVREAPGEVMLSDLVVGESYFALRHHYGVTHRDAIEALRRLLEDTRVRATGIAPEVLSEAAERSASPGLMDRLMHADYGLTGITLHTFDADAARLPGARLIA